MLLAPLLAFAVPLAAGAGSATVEKRPPALIRVVQSGLSNEVSRSEYFPDCGVELRNVSPSDARRVVVTVTWIDAHGRPLGAVRSDLALIPARRTFYLGCSRTDGLTVRATSLRVRVTVGRNTSHTGKLPAVTDMQLRRESCGERTGRLTPLKCGSQTLTGRIANRSAMRFSPDATIYAVFFDHRGRIVGGESDDTTAASLKPGHTVPFAFDLGPDVARAKVSVDPCGVDAFIGQCRLP